MCSVRPALGTRMIIILYIKYRSPVHARHRYIFGLDSYTSSGPLFKLKLKFEGIYVAKYQN